VYATLPSSENLPGAWLKSVHVIFFKKMRKSLGNKRNEISEDQRDEITRLYGDDGSLRLPKKYL
jgi:hypothetical protein